MTATAIKADEQLRSQIRDMRAYLLNQGYTHGSRAGELEGRADNGTEITVRTGYTTGSFRINVFGRVKGSRQGQHFVDINRGADPARVLEIQKALAAWDGQCWPPHPDFAKSPTGQGDGWPPK